MNLWKRLLPGVGIGLVFAAVLGGTVWLLRREAKLSTPAAPAATVTKPVKEGDLATIVLSDAAENSLGVETALVERKKVERRRTLGGEVQVPAGRGFVVTAPLTGRLKAPQGGVPRPGQAVKKGQAILVLIPLLTPEARTTLATTLVEAEGQVNNTTVQVDAARIALNRAKQLRAEEAASQRAVDEAQAQFDLAQKTLEAARGRRDLIARALREGEAAVPAIPIAAPVDGIVRTLSGADGQDVPPGAVLFEVIDPSVVWVRVPIYAGDAAEIDPGRPALVGELVHHAGTPQRNAAPVVAPPAGNPLTSTVDLFYQLDNRDLQFRPGQRVGATLTLRGEEQSLVVPCSAVVYDIHGNTWVYERAAERTYVRRRVLMKHTVGELAVLVEGPRVGAPIVTRGAAELFGTEMGFAK